MSYSSVRRFPATARTFLGSEVLRFAALLGTAAFLLDWSTKDWAVRNVLFDAAPLGAFTLNVARNDGFAFSAGAGMIPTWTIVAIRATVLLALVLLAIRFAAASYRFACGCALIIAGGLGNAADLVLRNGAVIDFIGAGPFTFHFRGELHYLQFVFNVADVLILTGIVLIIPLIRRVGAGTQRRLAAWEQRVLQGDQLASR
jgi:lipoprotein signal peptidase